VPQVDPPEPTRLGEVVWLEPYPDVLVGDGIDMPLGPEARYEQTDALVALLTSDVFVSMPPMPFEYAGRDVVTRFFASLFGSGRRFDLMPTRANGQPAFGAYLRASTGIRHGIGLIVLTLTGDRICAMTRFESNVLPSVGLPRTLPGR
jgi:hypothetical protein